MVLGFWGFVSRLVVVSGGPCVVDCCAISNIATGTGDGLEQDMMS